jgi:hypothetical protein
MTEILLAAAHRLRGDDQQQVAHHQQAVPQLPAGHQQTAEYGRQFGFGHGSTRQLRSAEQPRGLVVAQAFCWSARL